MGVMTPPLLLLAGLWLLGHGASAATEKAPAADVYFRIKCVDSETRAGVPLVLLRTANYIDLYSDSAGNIAFYEPGLMGQVVWFAVMADGYNVSNAPDAPLLPYPSPYDSGVKLNTTQGATVVVELQRTQVAQRVFRLTGGGLYRDSVLTGHLEDIPDSVKPRALVDPRSGSLGQDSLQVVSYQNTVWWFFGDTACGHSARQTNCDNTGMYSVGARSCLPSGGGTCDLSQPPGLTFFGEGGSPKPMAPIEPLAENTWVSQFITVKDGDDELLFGKYFKNPSGRNGVMQWDAAKNQFNEVSEWPTGSMTIDGGHPIRLFSPADAADGENYAFLSSGFGGSGLPQTGVDVPITVSWSHSMLGPFVNASKVIDYTASGSSCYNPLQVPHLDADGGKTMFIACSYTAMWSNIDTNPNEWTSCLFGANGKQNCAPTAPRYEYNNIVQKVDVSLILP
eukprot:gene5624-8576_t